MLLRARQFEFRWPRPALIMGIVNVTPDSFSDGGRFLDPETAAAHALKMVEEGADILDLGGESTRPGSVPVPEAEEIRRVLPVIERLAGRVQVPLSIDTQKPGVARAAIQAGASIVNDVGASREDDALWRVVAEAGAGYVCVHMKGNPKTMQEDPSYADVVGEVRGFFVDRLKRLNDCGVALEQTILDVGIGFGKSLEHNLRLLGALRTFTALERPLLLGASRKSFIRKLTGADVGHRLPASLACACLGVESGAHLVRVHDVAETVQALRITEAIVEHRI